MHFVTIAKHYQIRHGFLLETVTGIGNPGGKPSPSAGIYYAVPMSQGWQVMAYRYADVEDEIDHTQFWERYICRRLAAAWAPEASRPFKKLCKLLVEHPYGFPRGRVTCVQRRHLIYHGDDLSDVLEVNPHTIETIFGIKGKAKWVEDDHEHCLVADKEAVRELLSLETDWAAV